MPFGSCQRGSRRDERTSDAAQRTVPVIDLPAMEDDGKEIPNHLVRLARLDLTSGARSARRVRRHVDRGRELDGCVDLDRLVARLVLEALPGADDKSQLSSKLGDRGFDSTLNWNVSTGGISFMLSCLTASWSEETDQLV